MRTLLDPESVARGLRRMAGEIVERHAGARDLVLVAIRRGGIAVAGELKRWLGELEQHPAPLGTLDITLYRDDASTALPNPRIGASSIPCSLEARHVILVDDVLYTGRTVRAAIDALMDYGRPRLIELAVLVDRNGRERPFKPTTRSRPRPWRPTSASMCSRAQVASTPWFSSRARPPFRPARPVPRYHD